MQYLYPNPSKNSLSVDILNVWTHSSSWKQHPNPCEGGLKPPNSSQAVQRVWSVEEYRVLTISVRAAMRLPNWFMPQYISRDNIFERGQPEAAEQGNCSTPIPCAHTKSGWLTNSGAAVKTRRTVELSGQIEAKQLFHPVALWCSKLFTPATCWDSSSSWGSISIQKPMNFWIDKATFSLSFLALSFLETIKTMHCTFCNKKVYKALIL